MDEEAGVLQELTWLATRLQEPLDLEQVLQAAAAFTARVSGVERASVHLLDRDGRLVATARAGSPVHYNDLRWTLGEGLIGWVAENRQVLRTGDAPGDPRFVPRDDMKVPIQSFLGVPILRSEICVGVLSASHQEPDRFAEHHEEAAVLLAAICAPYIEMARLARLSTADALTGLLNRRGVDEILAHVDDSSLRRLSVVMADIDNFKVINDTHGHTVGDMVLRSVADTLAETVRESDAVARYGGEEFLMVLPGASGVQAARIADRAREAVGQKPVVAGEIEIPVTVSFGVAEWSPGESHGELVSRADEALYEAKEAGRDRVVTAQD